MRDVVEERLAARLRDLGDAMPDELPVPVDLVARVKRRRRRSRTTTRVIALAVAAAMATTLATVAIVHGAAGRRAVTVAVQPGSPAQHDALPAGTVLLAARGLDVIALDARGHTLATMIHAERGSIRYAQVTADHRWLWYLSLKHGASVCGDVVRADIDGRSSRIITQAVTFDISPDGTRLALYGAGDLVHGSCRAAATRSAPNHILVEDIATATSTSIAASNVSQLHWSPDGAYLVSASCTRDSCTPLERIDVPRDLRLSLVRNPGVVPISATRSIVSFGSDGLYALDDANPNAATSRDTVDLYDARTLQFAARTLTVDARWTVSQVAPTPAGVYVVALRPGPGRPGIYRIVAGRLVLVRAIDPGVLTAVLPLP